MAKVFNNEHSGFDCPCSSASGDGLASSAPAPNAATLATMRSAERKAAGLEHDSSPVFATANDAMEYLEA